MNIILREIKVGDLDTSIPLNYPNREFHNFNSPYYDLISYSDLRDEWEGENYDKK